MIGFELTAADFNLTLNIIDKLFGNETYIEGFCDSILLKLNEFYICKLLENVAEPTDREMGAVGKTRSF